MENIEKKTLDDLGTEFQYRAAKALFENHKFFKAVYSKLDQNCFSDPTLRRLIGIQKDIYSKNKLVPSYSDVEIVIRSKERNETELQYVAETIDKLKKMETNGECVTKEVLFNYMNTNYALVNIGRLLESIRTEGYNEKTYKRLLKECNNVITTDELGSEIKFTKDNVEKVLTESEGEVIPTGIKEIDLRITGGLGRTEIGLFTALTGYGKTTFGSIIAHNAAMLGFKVLQIYFEDKETNMLRKQISISTGNERINSFLGVKEERAGYYADKIVSTDEWKMKQENQKLIKMRDKQTTVENIEDEIEQLINNENFRPDLIIIDYFSCLKYSRNTYKDEWAAQADCMRKIKDLANEYDVAVWVLQQNNRPSNETVAGMGNWQGSFQATQPASVWIELQRTKEQKENGRADLVFNKTRNSQPKEDLLNIVFDNSRMLIDCSEEVQDETELMYVDK